MSAITYYFGDEVAAEVAEAEERVCIPQTYELRAGLAGLGESESCERPTALQASHVGLLNMVYVRAAIADALKHAKVSIQFGSLSGAKKNEVFLILDRPLSALPGLPEWNPPASRGARQYKLISWTSKMAAPSWSLPAGGASIGGTCPGALAGQSVTASEAGAVAVRAEVKKRLKLADVHLDKAICQHCLTGDTRVFVRGRGIVRLDEVGDDTFEVWSGKEWRTTHRIFQGVREVVTLETTWGQKIRLTSDHKVLTEHGMIEARDLEQGIAIMADLAASSPFPTAARLPAPLSAPEPHHNTLVPTLPEVWSEDVGYVLGAILGDGCIYYHERYPSVSIVGAHDQREAVERVHRVIGTWFDTAATIREKPSVVEATWRVGGLVRFFDGLGLDKRPSIEERRAPASIWTASEGGVRGFLRGLFDTDGSVGVSAGKVEVSLASVSRGLLEDVQLLLAAFGIRGSICEYRNAWRTEGGYQRLWKLGINAIDSTRLFAERIGFDIATKREKLAAALVASAEKNGRQCWPRVLSVTLSGAEEPVFDLVNVGPERQFLANGLVVSNCYAEGGQYSTGGVQVAQLLRLLWAQQAIQTSTQGGRSNAFIDTMIAAIGNTNFRVDGRGAGAEGEDETSEMTRPVPRDAIAEKTGLKFFRIHDSGDFANKLFVHAWRAIADALPNIIFWAPSRIWATPWGVEVVNRVNTPRRNLVIRPSAYHVSQAPPRDLGPGWAAGSTAIPKAGHGASAQQGMTEPLEAYLARVQHRAQQSAGDDPRYDWNCQAYAVKKGSHTCRHSTPPPWVPARLGVSDGCRACWLDADSEINYTLH